MKFQLQQQREPTPIHCAERAYFTRVLSANVSRRWGVGGGSRAALQVPNSLPAQIGKSEPALSCQGSRQRDGLWGPWSLGHSSQDEHFPGPRPNKNEFPGNFDPFGLGLQVQTDGQFFYMNKF